MVLPLLLLLVVEGLVPQELVEFSDILFLVMRKEEMVNVSTSNRPSRFRFEAASSQVVTRKAPYLPPWLVGLQI